MDATDKRIDRLERLMAEMYRDGAVRGVLWSETTQELMFTMQRDRALGPMAELEGGR